MEIKEHFEDYKNYLDLIDAKAVEKLVDLIYLSYKNNKTVFIIGNGGSASSASHLAEDLSKGSIIDQKCEKRIKALSLTDNTSFITAVGNDDGFSNIFVSQLRTFVNDDDLLIAISCSGNSENIIVASEYCRQRNMKIVGVTGFTGGELKEMSDLSIHIPINDFGIVESIHSIIFHCIVIALGEKISMSK